MSSQAGQLSGLVKRLRTSIGVLRPSVLRQIRVQLALMSEAKFSEQLEKMDVDDIRFLWEAGLNARQQEIAAAFLDKIIRGER